MAKSPCQTYRRRTRSYRNWLELPEDVTASILSRLDAIVILTRAQKVCMTWRRICKDRLMWRTIDMRNDGFLRDYDFDLEKMCRHGVDLSSGGLVDINVEHFGTDELLKYVTDSFASAQSLIGRSCPLLKSLKLNKYGYRYPYHECDDDTVAISSTMHDLRHLQLCGNKLTNNGLQKILDCCPNLESLNLRKCFNINFGVVLKRRCSKQIKSLRLPDEFDRANRRELYAQTKCDPDYGDFLQYGRSVFGRDW
ncbi:hypothetical protein ACLB2K_008231 [Fragaria x ananassa]